jgi:transposase
MEPKTHECSQSLGRLLGRAAAVSAINERIERIGSSTKVAGLFHELTAKSRPRKNYRSVGKLALFTKKRGDGGNPRRDLRRDRMRRFVEGTDRGQSTLFPECLEDWIGEDNAVRVIDVFVDELELGALGFDGVDPEATGRPSYHPSVLLKLYIYGYLNRVQSSRRLEHEAGRNVEVMWLTGRLAPDHKTIADFRKDNGTAIRKVCTCFIALCRTMGLLTQTSVAIDGSKFKAVNNRDKNFTRAKMERRMAQIEESVARYLQQLDTADRQEPSEALKTKTSRLKEKIEKLKEQMRRLEIIRWKCSPRRTSRSH